MFLQHLAQVDPRFVAREPHLGIGPYGILIIQIIIIVIALLVLWWILRGKKQEYQFSKDDSPLDILNKRYAAGELTKEDYERIKRDIA